MLIKVKCRKNLLYLFIYYLSSIINNTIVGGLLFSIFSRFDPLYICIFFYPFENIIGRLIVFLYQKYSVRKKEKAKYFGINFS